jgi:hypothetical protein
MSWNAIWHPPESSITRTPCAHSYSYSGRTRCRCRTRSSSCCCPPLEFGHIFNTGQTHPDRGRDYNRGRGRGRYRNRNRRTKEGIWTPVMYYTSIAYVGWAYRFCANEDQSIPHNWESIPIPIPTPTPMGTRSRRITNNWRQATAKPRLSQTIKKCSNPSCCCATLATRCQCPPSHAVSATRDWALCIALSTPKSDRMRLSRYCPSICRFRGLTWRRA